MSPLVLGRQPAAREHKRRRFRLRPEDSDWIRQSGTFGGKGGWQPREQLSHHSRHRGAAAGIGTGRVTTFGDQKGQCSATQHVCAQCMENTCLTTLGGLQSLPPSRGRSLHIQAEGPQSPLSLSFPLKHRPRSPTLAVSLLNTQQFADYFALLRMFSDQIETDLDGNVQVGQFWVFIISKHVYHFNTQNNLHPTPTNAQH